MQNRGMSGGGGSISADSMLMNIDNNQVNSILGASYSSSQNQQNFAELTMTYDSENSTWQVSNLPWAPFGNGSGNTTIHLYQIIGPDDVSSVGDYLGAPSYDDTNAQTFNLNDYSFDCEIVNGEITSLSNFNGFDSNYSYRIDWEILADSTVYSPINSNFMPWDEMDSRYANQGGDDESFTPENNSLLSWNGSAASSVLGAHKEEYSQTETVERFRSENDGGNWSNLPYTTTNVSNPLGTQVEFSVGNAGPSLTKTWDNIGDHITLDTSSETTTVDIPVTLELDGTESEVTINMTFTAGSFDEHFETYDYSTATARINSFTNPTGVEAESFSITWITVSSGIRTEPISPEFVPYDPAYMGVRENKIYPKGVILTSPDGTTYELAVRDDGTLYANRIIM